MNGPAALPPRSPRVVVPEGPAARGPGFGADLRPRFADLLRQRWDDPSQAPGLGTPADDALPWPEPLLPPPRRDDDTAQSAADPPAPPADAPVPQVTPQRDPPFELQAAGGPAAAAQAQGAGLSQHDPPRPVRDLANAVARFCNDRAVSDGEGWQVQIELRPDILPATTLLLSVSPHWLCLRFDIRDDTALHLVSMHQQALADRLEESLVRRRDISISFG